MIKKNKRAETNDRIRQHMTGILQHLNSGAEFTTESMMDKIEKKVPRARLNPRRIGTLLREFDQIVRLGQRCTGTERYGESPPIFWRKI